MVIHYIIGTSENSVFFITYECNCTQYMEKSVTLIVSYDCDLARFEVSGISIVLSGAL